jgi:hypothetical protein
MKFSDYAITEKRDSFLVIMSTQSLRRGEKNKDGEKGWDVRERKRERMQIAI